MNKIALAAIESIMLTASANPASGQFIATPKQLDRIAIAAIAIVAPKSFALPGFSVTTEGQPPDPHGYYLFEANWHGLSSGGSARTASLLINQYDGDVWDASTCQRLKSRKLMSEQHALLTYAKQVRHKRLAHHAPPACSRDN